MTFSMDMDLNASPVPDDDEQQPYDEPVEVEYAQEEHVESAVATLRRVLTIFIGADVHSMYCALGISVLGFY